VVPDVLADFRVRLWSRGKNVEDIIYRSKAVGEPPLMLAISAFLAIKDAVASVMEYRLPAALNAPATPEEVLRAVDELKARAGEHDGAASGRRTRPVAWVDAPAAPAAIRTGGRAAGRGSA
jgi:xanthine dehydrogenase large subunit